VLMQATADDATHPSGSEHDESHRPSFAPCIMQG